MMKQMEGQMFDHGEKLGRIQRAMEQLAARQRINRDQNNTNMLKNFVDTLIVIVVVFFVQYFLKIWNREAPGVKETW